MTPAERAKVRLQIASYKGAIEFNEKEKSRLDAGIARVNELIAKLQAKLDAPEPYTFTVTVTPNLKYSREHYLAVIASVLKWNLTSVSAFKVE